MFSLSMLRSLGAFALFATLTACSEPRSAADDAGTTCTPQDQSTTPADLSPATPKCAAAKGLPGDNVLCVDFDKISQLTDPALAGWNFNTSVSGNCMGWQISGGKLQVMSFSNLLGSCGITMPAFDLKVPANQKYNTIHWSIIQSIDVTAGTQQAQIHIGADIQGRQISSITGKNINSQTIINLQKSDLPAGTNSVFQPIIKLLCDATPSGAMQGWKIDSIAINLSP